MKHFLLAMVMFWFVDTISAQHDKAYFKKLKKAENLFQLERYEEAMPLFKELDEVSPRRAEVAYAIGFMLFNNEHSDEVVKSLPYLKFAVENINDTVPVIAYFYLGRSAQLNHEYPTAIKYLQEYRDMLPRGSQEIPLVDKYIKEAKHGKELVDNQKDVVIFPVAKTINSPYTEIAPLIDGLDTKLIFTSLRPKKDLIEGDLSSELVERVFISTREQEGMPWKEASLIDTDLKENIGASGLTPDATKMLLYVGSNNGDLYEAFLDGNKITKTQPLSSKINSKYQETSGSFSQDRTMLYFSSDRPNGKGGFDIFVSKKDEQGNWGSAENLGEAINSSFDERAPFIHPNGKYLYFHSNGHNSIGGHDIYRSELVDGKWQPAENMGYPINTAFNENYFYLSPDGKKGYFSSDRPGGYGQEDIYFLGIPEEQGVIPLTMVKGQIVEKETGKPIKASIKVVDKATGEQVKGVFDPQPSTGYYLMIFPPNKNYDMYISAEGYTPYVININIPNQTYFYELYQLIEMKGIKQFDEVVGQEVNVKNAFYNTGSSTIREVDERMIKEYDLVKDSLDLADLLDLIIASADKEAYDYFLELIFLEENVLDKKFDETKVKKGFSTYYEDESKSLKMLVLGQDTIFYAPGVDMVNPQEENVERKKVPSEVVGKIVKVYFEVGESDVPDNYIGELKEIYQILEQYDGAGLEISGFADATGDKAKNLKLSNERAQNVLEYFTQQGITRRRVVAKGFGQIQSEGYTSTGDASKDRRVEIKIIESPR